MDKGEAMTLLARELGLLRTDSYVQLATRVDADPVTYHRIGDNGNSYGFEIQAFWDDAPGGDVRVMVSVDDGGRRAFAPITDSFIKASDESLVEE